MKEKFDSSNAQWRPDMDANIIWLLLKQNYLNEQLRLYGYRTIYDVYRETGIFLKPSRVAGYSLEELCWVYEKGDYIDFRMTPNTDENVIYLDFNLDIE